MGLSVRAPNPPSQKNPIVNPSEIRWASQIWEPTPRPVLITGAYPGVKVYGTAPVDTVVGETAAAERLDLLGLERAARERKGLVCVCVFAHTPFCVCKGSCQPSTYCRFLIRNLLG